MTGLSVNASEGSSEHRDTSQSTPPLRHSAIPLFRYSARLRRVADDIVAAWSGVEYRTDSMNNNNSSRTNQNITSHC